MQGFGVGCCKGVANSPWGVANQSMDCWKGYQRGMVLDAKKPIAGIRFCENCDESEAFEL